MIWDIIRLTSKKAQHAHKLCERLGCSLKELSKEVAKAQAQGFSVRFRDGMVSSKSPSVGAAKTVVIGSAHPGRKHVAIVTDTHFGSTHTDLRGLTNFLEMVQERGIRTVVCTGDVLDGNKEVLLHEQSAIGFDHQAEIATDTLSAFPKLKFVAVDGNHDGYFSSSSGMVSGVTLEHRMQEAGIDWTFAGVCLGRALVHGARWQLWHPHGGAGTRNAIRRILNSRIEALEEPCDVLAIGHFHKFATVSAYPENVFGVAGGTWQTKRSEFANRISNGWDIGGAVVSYTIRPDGRAAEFSAEFFPSCQ